MVIVTNNKKEFRISVNDIEIQALLLLTKFREKTDRIFPIPEIEEFIKSFKLLFKSEINNKSDIRIVIYGQRTRRNNARTWL